MDKETRKLIKKLRQQGFEVDDKRRHPMVYLDGRRVYTLTGTSGDWRSLHNAEADLKRHGYKPNA